MSNARGQLAESRHLARMDKLILDLIPYMLGVTSLDVDSLDVTFAMDFDCAGNHDEVIAEALFGNSAFGCLLELPNSKPIVFSPAMVISLADNERTQVRVCVESKTSIYEPGEKDNGHDESISLTLTIRQYPQTDQRFDPAASFERQCQLAEEIMAERIIRHFVQPLTEVIAQRRST